MKQPSSTKILMETCSQ